MTSHLKKSLSVLLSLMLTMIMLMSVSAMSTDDIPAGNAGANSMTLTVEANVTGDSAEEINQVLEESRIVASGELTDQLKTTLKLIVSGADLFTVRSEIGADQLVIEVPQVLSNSILINYEALANNLGSQIQALLDASGIDLNAILESLSSSFDVSAAANSEDIEEIIAPYTEILMNSIQNTCKVQQDAEISLKYGIEPLTGEVYTWAPTAEEFADLLSEIGALMKEDSRLIDFYRQQMDQQRSLFSMYAMFGDDFSEEDLEEAYAEIDEILDELPDLLVENAAEYGEALAEMALQVNAGVVDGTPVAVVLSFDEGMGQIVSLGYENSDGKYYLYFDEAGQDYALRFSTDETDEDSVFEADVLAGGFSMASLYLQISKVEVTRLGVPSVYADLEIGTSFSTTLLLKSYDDVDMLTFTMNGIDSLTGTTDITGVEINATLSEESAVEDIQQESIDISNYTAEEFGALFEKIGEGFTEYFGTGF